MFASNYRLIISVFCGELMESVDMWDSKSHAARRASSSLALPTMRNFLQKEWIYFLVRSSKLITSGCRNIVGICRNSPTMCLNKVYRV